MEIMGLEESRLPQTEPDGQQDQKENPLKEETIKKETITAQISDRGSGSVDKAIGTADEPTEPQSRQNQDSEKASQPIDSENSASENKPSENSAKETIASSPQILQTAPTKEKMQSSQTSNPALGKKTVTKPQNRRGGTMEKTEWEDPSLELRTNKLFYIKRKYIQLIDKHQLRDGFKYTNDYLEYILESFFAAKEDF